MAGLLELLYRQQTVYATAKGRGLKLIGILTF